MHRFVILSALAACHPTPRPPAIHAELIYAATQGYGVQPAGQDKGTVYAFVKIDAASATRLGVTSLSLQRDGAVCAHATTAPKLARVDRVTKDTASQALTLDALAHGTPFDGTVTAGSNYLRIAVEVDHACSGNSEPTLAVTLDTGETLLHSVDEQMPS